MKTGLVVEGGGTRGIYTAGVLDVLYEKGVRTDGLIGVSAGAIHGANYVSGQVGRSVGYMAKYSGDKRYMSFRSLLTTGDLFNEQFCYHEIPEKLDVFDNDAMEASQTAFYVCCTDLDTGKAVYHQCKNLRDEEMDWVRASASLPLLSRWVEKDGKKLLDGGVADSVPLIAFEQMGYDRNVVILTQPAGYQKKRNKAMGLIARRYKQFPAFVQAMENRHLAYNQTLSEISRQEREGRIFVVRPSSPIGIGRTETSPEKIRNAYAMGCADGQRQADKIIAFLTGNKNMV